MKWWQVWCSYGCVLQPHVYVSSRLSARSAMVAAGKYIAELPAKHPHITVWLGISLWIEIHWLGGEGESFSAFCRLRMKFCLWWEWNVWKIIWKDRGVAGERNWRECKFIILCYKVFSSLCQKQDVIKLFNCSCCVVEFDGWKEEIVARPW